MNSNSKTMKKQKKLKQATVLLYLLGCLLCIVAAGSFLVTNSHVHGSSSSEGILPDHTSNHKTVLRQDKALTRDEKMALEIRQVLNCSDQTMMMATTINTRKRLDLSAQALFCHVAVTMVGAKDITAANPPRVPQGAANIVQQQQQEASFDRLLEKCPQIAQVATKQEDPQLPAQLLYTLWNHMQTTLHSTHNHPDLIKITLEMAILYAGGTAQRLGSQSNVFLWAPASDSASVRQVLGELQTGDYGDFLKHLKKPTTTTTQSSSDPPRLFVDGGSNLGFVTTLAALELNQPSNAATTTPTAATIISIEAAAPTWIVQQLNLACNAPHFLQDLHQRYNDDKNPHDTTPLSSSSSSHHDDHHHHHHPRIYSMLAALGRRDQEGSYLEMKFRAESTITMRPWDEHTRPTRTKNVPLIKAPIRTLRSILKEVIGGNSNTTSNEQNDEDAAPSITSTNITVLKLDCEGCEYDVVPDWQASEYNAIQHLIGEIHYGFIPLDRAPSFDRCHATHRRLCQFLNFANVAKECCAYPDMTIKDHHDGGMAIRNMTVFSQLCGDFPTWTARNQLLDESRTDAAWLGITAKSKKKDS